MLKKSFDLKNVPFYNGPTNYVSRRSSCALSTGSDSSPFAVLKGNGEISKFSLFSM